MLAPLLTRHRHRAVGRLHELAAEHQWIGDVRGGLERAAGARDDDRPVVEDATPEALLDAQRLDLVDVDLDGVALDEAELRDDAAVRDRDLGLVHVDPRHREEHEAQQEPEGEDADQHEAELRPPRDMRAMDELLALDEGVVDIGHVQASTSVASRYSRRSASTPAASSSSKRATFWLSRSS